MPKIVQIDVARFDYAVAGEFKFFKPGPDGRVRRPSVLVRLTNETGRIGWGQAVPAHTWTYETVETVLTTLEHYLAPVVIGRDAADFAGLHAAMNAAIRPAFSVGQPLCKAALDLACFDLIGQERGVPAWQLFGPPVATRDRLTLSWTVASPKMDVVERQLAEGRARGYRNFNIKVAAPQTADYDLELARKVRAFAPDGFLWADANVGYTPEEALRLAPQLRAAGVDVLESPLPPHEIRGYQALKRQGALPILMDEGILSTEVAGEFAALEMFDGIAMKPARNAGLWPSVQIVRMLRERGLMVLGSGLTDPDFSLAASLHLFAWSDIFHPCALNGPQFLADSLTGNSLVPQGDLIAVPNSPGLGVTPDPRAMQGLKTVARL
jgi:L-alanine-DL-glutamate epimerase-like enolase superfamily enzyme